MVSLVDSLVDSSSARVGRRKLVRSILDDFSDHSEVSWRDNSVSEMAEESQSRAVDIGTGEGEMEKPRREERERERGRGGRRANPSAGKF